VPAFRNGRCKWTGDRSHRRRFTRARADQEGHRRIAREALDEIGPLKGWRSGHRQIQDITTRDQTGRFVALQEKGDLTCRVRMRPDLSRGAELKDKGVTMGSHPVTKRRDHYLRYGALKGYIDGIMGAHGALFFDSYDDQPGNFGHYRPHTSDDPKLLVPTCRRCTT
jgi:predicted amidohydrolase YtcJ